MHFSTPLSLLALAASSTTASLIKVAVGQNGLTFTPNNFDAQVGDFVEFSFFPKNHTVTQSSFGKPCQPLDISPRSGIFSGFVPTQAPGPNAQTFTIHITDTKPIWLYCGQTVGNHCQSGMVAAINAPKSGYNTFENFVLLAQNASTSTSPEGGLVSGGILGPAAGDEGGKSYTYTSATLTVTSEYEYETASVIIDPLDQATVTTTVVVAVPTTLTVISTWPVQSGVAGATGTGGSGGNGGNGGNGASSTNTPPAPTASFEPNSGNGMVAKAGFAGVAAFGAAMALL